ncbi:hypothetical protein B0H10DRAFT_1938054 [Mycena sp. CBHHK59/15]|nr:hypothetical protein B0H10DRAFT_1938054 [Mycena sp. CBHHK59/15]
MSGKETTQAWYWAYLVKHPDWYSRVKDVKDRSKHGDKPKVYCRAHFDADIRAERAKDHQQGAEAWTDKAIGRACTSRYFLLLLLVTITGSVVQTTCFEAGLDDWKCHNCVEPPQELRPRSCGSLREGKGKSDECGHRIFVPKQAESWPSWFEPVSCSLNNSNSYLGAYPISAHDSREGEAPPTLHLNTSGSSLSPFEGSHNVFGGSENFAFPPDLQHGLHCSSSVVSLAPSDSISAVVSQHSVPRMSHSHSRSRPVSASLIPGPWDATKQALFEEKVLRLTVWQIFLLLGLRTRNGWIFAQNSYRRALKEFRADVQSNLTGKNATIQGDGWTGINHHHLNAFMATVERTLHTIKVFEDSAERKTAENYLAQLVDVFKMLGEEWKVVVVAVTTDALGESHKARLLFAKGHPWVVVLDCYAHQINLIVGDYFKANSVYMAFVDQAVELISWLRSKTLVLALIQEAQEGLGERPSAIIRAVITCWTAHYQAFRQLQQVQSALTAMIEKEMKAISGKAAEVCKGTAQNCTKWQEAKNECCYATLDDYGYTAADAPDGAVCTATCAPHQMDTVSSSCRLTRPRSSCPQDNRCCRCIPPPTRSHPNERNARLKPKSLGSWSQSREEPVLAVDGFSAERRVVGAHVVGRVANGAEEVESDRSAEKSRGVGSVYVQGLICPDKRRIGAEDRQDGVALRVLPLAQPLLKPDDLPFLQTLGHPRLSPFLLPIAQATRTAFLHTLVVPEGVVVELLSHGGSLHRTPPPLEIRSRGRAATGSTHGRHLGWQRMRWHAGRLPRSRRQRPREAEIFIEKKAVEVERCNGQEVLEAAGIGERRCSTCVQRWRGYSNWGKTDRMMWRYGKAATAWQVARCRIALLSPNGDVVSGKAAEVCKGTAWNCTKWQEAKNECCYAMLDDYGYTAADAPDGAVCTATAQFRPRMVRHLNPLAIACNVVQAAFCSLDTVLLAFGLLYAKYQIFLHEDDSGYYTDEEDSGIRAVLNSLETRGKKAGGEQEVFIAAVLLTPFFKNALFARIPILNRAGIDLTFERLWTRFFRETVPSDLRKNSREYFDGTGFFAGLQSYCDSEIEWTRVDQDIVLDPLEALDHQFGLILTKLRNRMAPGTLTDLAEYKMHIRDEHLHRDDEQTMGLPPRSSAELPHPPRTDDEDNETHIPAGESFPHLYQYSLIFSAAPPTTTKSAFRKFIEDCQELAVEDDLIADYDDMELEVPLIHHHTFKPVLLSELFDYTNKHWVKHFETSRGMSLDQEMELYELLDFDAEGEAEDDMVDVDDITESILVA